MLSILVKRIWLIGGTSESANVAFSLVDILKEKDIICFITVTTEDAIKLYLKSSFIKVKVGKMTFEEMKLFCLEKGITNIIDSSHPFAIEVSRNAIAVSQLLNIPYLRYERPNINDFKDNSNINTVSSFDEILNSKYLENKKVLLTIGTRYLSLFKPWQEKSNLFVRILPNNEALKIALESGFTSNRIIAFRPPLNEDLEIALWRHWQIDLVISKASGKAGGEDIKHKVSQKLNIPLILIKRPSLDYPQITHHISDILKFITLSAMI